jgi:tRNA (guanine-N7-)-methyltransferase
VPHRRNPYADRLNEFADFAFADDGAFARRGRWRDFFRGRIGPAFDGRVVFEIGCADADFLARMAAKHPAVAFVGLDWKPRTVYEGAARVSGMALRNVAVLHGRAQDVRHIFSDGELDEIWLFHPDPCDKPNELKHRLVSEPFLLDAHAVLRGPGSTLTLKTDHPGYYQWTLALLGLPEPAALRANPRVKTKELMAPENLPPASAAAMTRFDLTMNSADFWNDDAALSHASRRPFAGERTAFESRFAQKRRPIYYVELASRTD